jgi:hypothetical protein
LVTTREKFPLGNKNLGIFGKLFGKIKLGFWDG